MTQSQQIQQWWHPISKKLSSKGPIVWLLSHTLHHLDRIALYLSSGRVTAANILTGFPLVTLTTTGARSGKDRSVPLIAFPDGDNLIFVASNWGQQGHPSWYYNLRANPEATVTVQKQSKEYVVHEAAGSERERYWNQVVDTHPGYAAYEQRTNGREIPILVCVPKKNPPINDLADG